MDGALARWALTLVMGLGTLTLAACGAGEEPAATPTLSPAAGSPTPSAQAPFIDIDIPSDGETVGVPVHVEGRARVFEGALLVAVRDSGGDEICRVSAQASEGGPGVGTWAVDVAFEPPAAARATVEAYSESPRDGSVENLVSVSVNLSTDLPPIVVSEPDCNESVSSPIHIEGTASVFEGALVVAVKDIGGEELARAYVQASEGAPGRGTFAADIELPPGPSGPMQATVEAFSLSPRDGSVENLFAMPIVLEPAP